MNVRGKLPTCPIIILIGESFVITKNGVYSFKNLGVMHRSEYPPGGKTKVGEVMYALAFNKELVGRCEDGGG